MLDPFPIPPIPWLSKAVQPFADYTSLTTLPLHIHEVLIAFSAYTFINYVVAPQLSKRIFPVQYAKLSADRRINWDVHVVSFVQSCTISVLALWVMWTDGERGAMDWQQRIWGYTGGAGMIQGMATGYFLWDLMITLQNPKLFGPGMLAHALSALIVFSFGFRPFVNYYGCTFILYELSTPFLNLHWFFDKLEMTGSRAQLYNGFVLLTSFFSCRLVWGTYQSARVYQDIWAALHHEPAGAHLHLDRLASDAGGAVPIHTGTMRFAGEEFVPLWLALTYLGSNVVLNTLNFYWFAKMIDMVRKRFQPAKAKPAIVKEAPIVSVHTGPSGKAQLDVDKTEVRRRIAVEEEPLPAVA